MIQCLGEKNRVNPVRELCPLTTKDDGIEPPSIRNNLYHRHESVAFSNGVNNIDSQAINPFYPVILSKNNGIVIHLFLINKYKNPHAIKQLRT